MGSVDVCSWMQLHIPPLLFPCFPRSKVAPCALLPSWVLQGEAGGEKSCGRSSQRRMFPVLGVFLISSHTCLPVAGFPCNESCFACAASACKAPFEVSHLTRDHPPDPCRLSILYCFAWESQNLQEREQDRDQQTTTASWFPADQEIDCLLQMPVGRERIPSDRECFDVRNHHP